MVSRAAWSRQTDGPEQVHKMVPGRDVVRRYARRENA
jgi:hypothetical protein